jgi:hypothetical protein
MLDEVLLSTVVVAIANVALEEPAGTVTLDGTVAAEASLDKRATTAPPAGAVALSVTVACEGEPPTTLIGLSEMDETVTGASSTDSVAD